MLLAAQFSLVALGLFLRHGPPQIPPSAARAPAAQLLAHAPLTVQKCGDGTCLHVSAGGHRRVCRTSRLPAAPDGHVRLVFVSDTHEQLEQVRVPPGDILVHCGDITFCSRGGNATLVAFNEVLRALPHAHKVVIAGNHDKRIEQLGKAAVREFLTEATYLENSGVRLCGLNFWGSPFSARRAGSRSSNTAFQYPEGMQQSVMKYVPNDVDVLLTHGGGGSASLREAVDRVRPLVHACGHDHERHGATLHGGRGSSDRLAPRRVEAQADPGPTCGRHLAGIRDRRPRRNRESTALPVQHPLGARHRLECSAAVPARSRERRRCSRSVLTRGRVGTRARGHASNQKGAPARIQSRTTSVSPANVPPWGIWPPQAGLVSFR